MGKGFVDQCIELSVDAVERCAQREGQHSVVAGEHGQCRSEHAGFQAREQAGHLPAVRREEVTMGPGWSKDTPSGARGRFRDRCRPYAGLRNRGLALKNAAAAAKPNNVSKPVLGSGTVGGVVPESVTVTLKLPPLL